jgi:hypothetical protein
LSLQGLLAGLRPGDLLSTSRPCSPDRVDSARTRLAALFETVADLPEHEDLDALEGRIRRALDEDNAARLARRDWRMLPYALWLRDPPLVQHAGLLPALRARLKAGSSARLLRNLLSAYLRAFDPRLPRLAEIARLIDEHRFKMDEIWWRRVETYQLTQPEKAPHAIFLACIRADQPPEALEEAGIDPDVHHGILRATLLAGTQAIERNFPVGRWNAKAMDFVEGQIFAEDALVEPELRRALADAYLRPWLNGDPSDGQLKTRIQDFMLRRYGDPRTRPQRWTGVSDEARTVMRRWLVKVVLDQFLDVIDELAFERQWKYRRAFWLGYFREGWISEADVLFGPQCMKVATRLFGKNAPCAALVAGQKIVDNRHAVLLMKIGSLIIADWSHNGRCVVWSERDAGAPHFGRTSYSSTDVYPRGGDWALMHQGSEGYSWQRRLRDKIFEETGLSLTDRKFQVQ